MSQTTLVLEKLLELSKEIDKCLEMLNKNSILETTKLEIQICTYAQEITIGKLFENRDRHDILGIIQEGIEGMKELSIDIQTNLTALKGGLE